MRVVSLLPSATETLCLLGGSKKAVQLVGRSHECDYPQAIEDRPVLTSQTTDFTTSAAIDREVSESLAAGKSLYTLNAQLLRDLEPDLILTQDLCDVCSIDLATVQQVAASMPTPPKVLSLNPKTFEDVLDDVLRVGAAVGMADEAAAAVVGLRERFFRAAECVNAYETGPSVVFLEWIDPPYIAGHWTPQLIERAGATHPLHPTTPHSSFLPGAGAAMATSAGQMSFSKAGKSFAIEPSRIAEADPDVLIVCPCGLDLKTAQRELEDAEQLGLHNLRAVREGRVAIVDGSQMFNRPGPRLVDAFEWLVGWLHDRPDRIPKEFPWAPWTP